MWVCVYICRQKDRYGVRRSYFQFSAPLALFLFYYVANIPAFFTLFLLKIICKLLVPIFGPKYRQKCPS